MKTWTTATGTGVAVLLALAGSAQATGASSVTSSHAIGLPTAGASVPAAKTPTSRATPAIGNTAPAPATVVEDFYAALNARDYRRAWDLGGNHLGQTYASFVGGFAETAFDAVSIDGVSGSTVDVRLHTIRTDGSAADYAGTYTVENGTITHGSLHQVANGDSTGPPPSPTPLALNPAVSQSTVRSTICVHGWAARARPPAGRTEEIKKRQLAASSVADKKLAHYEEDHIVPLELGGAPLDPANLRPVPLARAHTDDRLEDSLHRAVCSGTMPLAAAQAQIAQAKSGEAQP
ncbi:hypothetical protein N4G70_27320 [Streptomyces sp. ASQP_92]|uniref:hypothetical protein n=1 Tax=Streptomyces sp. ASQP_92 TaxID=2979116 RepID=UPI0021BEFE48|nr:hypothetical protein [Streptomyces sp. ASQP_92]MCT9092554.1 hypothetical protein [Streptomyces sp. ASQP_92]